MLGPAINGPQALSNPVIAHFPLKFCLVSISSSGGTVIFVRRVLVGGVLAIGVSDWLDGLPAGTERRGLFTGEDKVEKLGVTSSERLSEGIGKNLKMGLRFKIIFLAQPRHKSV